MHRIEENINNVYKVTDMLRAIVTVNDNQHLKKVFHMIDNEKELEIIKVNNQI